MLTTAVVGDKCTHGATIITGSPTRKVNGQAVARLGDLVDCPIHGKNKIITVTGGMPLTDGLPTAHENAKTVCGAVILKSIFNTPMPGGGTVGGDLVLMENDDTIGDGGPIGTSPEAQALQRAITAASAGSANDSSPTSADGAPDTRAVPAGCQDIPPDAGDSFKISQYFTLGDLSSQTACARSGGASGPVVANLGLSRSEIICNLRHLAVNLLDPIAAHYGRRNIMVTSGFRHNSNGSDHNIGSAADVQFFFDGAKADGRKLDEIEKYIINTLKLPFTQIIHENNSWLHFACRRTGGNSAKRVCWWQGGDYISGYRY